jgi:hypothetical protein
MKKVDSAVNDTGYGDGWFKIWDEGYDTTANQWCTGKVINNGGLLSVDIPKGIAGGDYLIRPELLTLHNVPSMNQPQYYLGCGQLFVQSNGTLAPTSTVTIPGHVKLGDPADSFNIYDNPLKLPYPMPGPSVAVLQSSTATSPKTQPDGAKPAGCILESGNFCAIEVPSYSDAAGCQSVSLSPFEMSADKTRRLQIAIIKLPSVSTLLLQLETTSATPSKTTAMRFSRHAAAALVPQTQAKI